MFWVNLTSILICLCLFQLDFVNFVCNISDGNITVVATGVGGGNEVAMNPHIQILSSDSNDQQQHHVQLQDSKHTYLVQLQYILSLPVSIVQASGLTANHHQLLKEA